MRVTLHLPRNQIHFNYSQHQQMLEQVRSAKYLGLTITDNLEWGQHVSEISCKATKTLGFLQSHWALAPRHTKEIAYKTLVHPQLVYVAPIWHPYNTGRHQGSYLENVLTQICSHSTSGNCGGSGNPHILINTQR